MNSRKMPRLALGTVQLGVPYGIANKTGMPSERSAVALIRDAIKAGITTIDTARAYGDAERRVGLALHGIASTHVTVTTKLDPLADVAPDDPNAAITAAAMSLDMSRAALRKTRLDCLMLHRAEHRTKWNGAVWQLLSAERDAGRIERLGVSVQYPKEALDALTDRNVLHIQLPFNVLDRRWREAGAIDELRKRPEVTVHVRSVFLQGLLTEMTGRWPTLNTHERDVIVDRLRSSAQSLGRQSLADFCLAYVRSQDWIDAIILGMETEAQLAANIASFRAPLLSPTELRMVDNNTPRVKNQLLDPSQWKSHQFLSD